MPDPDLLFRPVTELAGLVRDGEVRARELVELSLGRIEELDPQVGAFVDVRGERALAEADQVTPGDDRPLAGVPIAIKNNRQLAGERITFCSELFGDHVAAADTALVRRLREAGAIVVGTTKLPEFGILPVTEPRRFGPARNPWDLERTPGGSSGGSAAAVAAGMVPMAHANDGGGSTRIPAACTGLVGLKPQRGRISVGPEQGESYLVADGVLTRTVAETAAVLDLLHGPEPGDASWAPPPAEPYADAVARAPGTLRIALATRSPLQDEAPVDPAAVRATEQAAELLRELGHEVEEATPPWEQPGLVETFVAVFGAQIGLSMFFGGLLTGREPSEDLVEPLSWAIWEHCRGVDVIQGQAALGQVQLVARALVGWMQPYDLLLTPALGQRPVRIGEIDACSATPMEDFRRSAHFTPFTAAFNMTGQPAISVPFAHGDDGLPLGVQLVGQPAREDVVLGVAAQMEEARGWAERRPALAVA